MSQSGQGGVRVLHVFNELRFSGAEMMMAAGAELLGAKDSAILSTGEYEGEFVGTLRNRGYEVLHVPFSKSAGFFRTFGALVKKSKFDVIHIHTERGRFWYALICCFLGKPVVTTIHSEFIFEGRLRYIRGFQRRLAGRLGTTFIACSNRVARNEHARFGITPKVIPNWCDPTRVQRPSAARKEACRKKLLPSSAEFLTVSIANESPVKNLAELVKGIALLDKRYHHIHIGSVSDELIESARTARGGRFQFAGSTTSIGDFLSASDAFVCSSTNEGGPLVLMEAAIMGVPCVTTDVGIAEDFRGLPGACLVEPNAEDIAAGIRQACEVSKSEWEYRSDALANFASLRFQPSIGASQYAALYAALNRRSVKLA